MQVWVENRCVGELRVDVPNGCRSHVLSVMETDFDPWEEPDLSRGMDVMLRRINLPLSRRSVVIDDFDLQRNDPALLQLFRDTYHVPEDATISRDFRLSRHRFEWRVFDLDLGTYEQVFDLDTFQPL